MEEKFSSVGIMTGETTLLLFCLSFDQDTKNSAKILYQRLMSIIQIFPNPLPSFESQHFLKDSSVVRNTDSTLICCVNLLLCKQMLGCPVCEK